jgi:hypothetical protein
MRFLTVLLIGSVLPAFAATHEQPSNVLHYRTRNSMILVTVAIDGKNRTLVFDTGAEQTMINFPQVSREQNAPLAAQLCLREGEKQPEVGERFILDSRA